MEKPIHTIISGTGCYIPNRVIPNEYFLDHLFYDRNGKLFERSNEEIIRKFEEITGIRERRYVTDDLLASDIAAEAGKAALEDAGTEAESLDYIIVAHNFGDIRADNCKVDMVPSLASRVKEKLGIDNPYCVAYDLPFGCPGWLQGVIQADSFIRSGEASKALVIGSETLSRVCDPHDRDSMIYADGAGAIVVEGRQSDFPTGILSTATRTDTTLQAYYLNMDTSYNPDSDNRLYLKMEGRKLYQYALNHVPGLVKRSLDRAHIQLDAVDKVFIHQANAKMDHAILQRLGGLYDIDPTPADIMPMTISWLGNSSVATVPTLLDLVRRGQVEGHAIEAGNRLVMASVGAGMNINALVYQVPES